MKLKAEPRSADTDRMSELVVTRWKRYGKDRLYVNDAEGARVGWLCRQTGTVAVEVEARRSELLAALEAHPDGPRSLPTPPCDSVSPAAVAMPSPAPAPSGPSPGGAAEPVPTPAPSVEPSVGTAGTQVAAPSMAPAAPSASPTAASELERAPASAASPLPSDLADYLVRIDYTDVAVRRPGQAAREQAVAHRKAAPIRSFTARLLGRHTDERAWRIGADGEELVAVELGKLGDGWHALHAIPVGTRGADIDHLVIGPGGVFTVNAKHHPGAKVWVGGNTVIVNGQRRPYVRNARHEAERAARLLSAAVDRPVGVEGVVALVGLEDLTVKSQPEGVAMVGRRRLRAWLHDQPNRLDESAVTDVYNAARRSTTWR